MKSKICFKCNELKTLDMFYKHSQMSDGHLNKCKECNKTDVQNNYQKNRDKYVEYEINRLGLPHRKEARKNHAKYLREHFPEKVREYHKKYDKNKKNATVKLRRAVLSGIVKKHNCQICDNPISHGHHYDYSKPLDVIWLCKIHHCMAHRKHNKLDISHLIKQNISIIG